MGENVERDDRPHRRSGDDRVPWKGIAIGLLTLALTAVSTEWYRAKDDAANQRQEHQNDHDARISQGTTIEYMQRDLAYVTKRVEEIGSKQDDTARTVEAIGRVLGVATAPKPGAYVTPPTPRFRNDP